MEQQQRAQAAMSQFFAKPFEQRSLEDYESLVQFLPKESFAALQNFAKQRTEKQNANAARLYSQMAAGIRGKSPEYSVQLARQAAEGEANPQQKQAFTALANAIEKTPEAAFDMIVIEMMGLEGNYSEAAKKIFEVGAAADPMKLAERQAELAKKIADAQTAQANATTQADRNRLDMALKGFQAQKARIDAEVAATEQRLTGGVGASADVRTAIAAANLPANIKRVMYELESIKQPKTVIEMGGRAEAEARAKDLVAENRDLQNAAAAGQRLLASVDVMENLLDSGFETGWATEAKAAAASFLSALGVPEATKFATSAQTFLAQSREQLLQKLILQKGPQTEGDSQRATQTLATLGNTKEANRFILAFTKAVERRGIDKAKFYRQFEKTNGTFKGADTAWEDGPGDKSIFDSPFLAPFRNIAQGRSAQGQVPPAAPPSQPTAQATGVSSPTVTTRPLPPQAAIDYLRRNPSLAGAFDEMYGQGLASRILGGQ